MLAIVCIILVLITLTERVSDAIRGRCDNLRREQFPPAIVAL